MRRLGKAGVLMQRTNIHIHTRACAHTHTKLSFFICVDVGSRVLQEAWSEADTEGKAKRLKEKKVAQLLLSG